MKKREGYVSPHQKDFKPADRNSRAERKKSVREAMSSWGQDELEMTAGQTMEMAQSWMDMYNRSTAE